MRKSLYLCLFLLHTLPVAVLAQEPASITAPTLELKNNKIIISYDILNSTRRDLYDIWIEVTDTAGKKIEANALTGDVGEGIKGGSHRVISWDLAADAVYLDAGIYVQVYGERLTSTAAETLQMTDNQPNPYKSMGQSILFPGFGLAKLGKTNMHLAKGFLAYGSATAAITINQLGVSNYNEYITNPDYTKAENDVLYAKVLEQKKWSNAFGYFAVAIWVGDLAWTYLSTSKMINAQKDGQSGKIRMHFNYDPKMQAPVLCLRYTF